MRVCISEAAQCLHTGARQLEESPRPSVAVIRAARNRCVDVSLALKPFERRVHRTDRDVTPGPLLDLAADAHAVGFPLEPGHRKHDDLFQLSEVCATTHRSISTKQKQNINRNRRRARPDTRDYSVLNATSGSTRVARRAGT